MPPAELKDFFVVTAGAAATFIGLLFVAISFVFNNEKDTEVTATTKRILAEGSYAALINAFFISIVALVPDTTISYVTIAMAIVSLGASLHFLRNGTKVRHSRSLLTASLVLYLVELLYGLSLLFRPDGYITSRYAVMTLFVFLFSIALTRAWELTGIRNKTTKS